jgi:3-isopropylmalate/(R)-2-methylmalate dehydratase small subunit
MTRANPSKVIVGRVWKFGDNIDTDIIAPGDTISFGLSDEEERRIVRENAFRSVRPGLYKLIRPGDILVAGRNFGLGSHREPANTVLANLGFAAVIAESIARLFFRNSVAIGFHALQVPDITRMVEEGDELKIDMENWRLDNLTNGKRAAIEPYSDLVQRIIEAGGILEVLKARIKADQSRQNGSRG